MNSFKKLLSVVLTVFMLTVLFCGTVKATGTEAGTFELVTDATKLSVGDQIIITNATANSSKFYSLDANPSSNNFGQVEVTISENKITPSNSVLVIELVAGSASNTFGLKATNGSAVNKYLYAASSKSNYLKTQDSVDANGSFAISISSGKATLIAQGTNTRNSIRYNSGSSIFSCYSSGQGDICIYKLNSTKQSVILSLDKSNVFVGDTITAEYTLKNIDTATDITWTSSDNSVAEFDNNGCLVTKKMGTTNVKVSVSGIESEETKVSVYPDNTNPVTITLANQICDTFISNTAYKYFMFGTVTSKETAGSAYNLTITDGTDNFVVYSYLNKITDVAVGDKVWVSGPLVKYTSGEISTNEFTIAEVKYAYSVTYKDGEQELSKVDFVKDGEKISAPANPEKNGYEFLYWVDNNDEAWDFANDTVSSDLVLNAKWMSNNLNSMVDALNAIETRAALGYTYEDEVSTVKDELTVSDFPATSTTYVNFTGVFDSSSAKYAGNSAKNGGIQLRSDKSSSGIVSTVSGGNITKVVINWNTSTTAGRTINVYGSNVAYTQASDLYDSKTQGTLIGTIVKGTSTELVISDKYAYVGIRSNSGALNVTSVEFVWDGISFKNDDFRIKAGIDKDIAQVVDGLDGAVYGIEVSQGEKTVKFASTDAAYNKTGDADFDYVVIDLGEALQNRDRLSAEFTFRAYVTYEGQTYYSTTTKTVSVLSLLEVYNCMNGVEYQNAQGKTPADLVAGTVALFEALGYTFGE